MRILVWQWGRRGGGPRYAVELVEALGGVPGTEALLSLSAQSEILAGSTPPVSALTVPTYENLTGLLWRMVSAPFALSGLAARLRALRLDVAICAMPAPLDLLMAAALRRAGVPMLVVVHDADLHPGDGFPMQMTLQRMLVRRADGLVVLTEHVAARLREQHLVGTRPLIMTSHPPRRFGPVPPPPRAHGGALRLLSFGRLLPYKGLDLLAEALTQLGPRTDLQVRVIGSGPESPTLAALRALPNVTVENRWVPESEIGEVIGWADALVLSHREASQSGAAAAAIAARRWVVATRVGGIAEQLADEPLARLAEPTAAALASALKQLLQAPPALPDAQPPEPSWEAGAKALVHDIASATGPISNVPTRQN